MNKHCGRVCVIYLRFECFKSCRHMIQFGGAGLGCASLFLPRGAEKVVSCARDWMLINFFAAGDVLLLMKFRSSIGSYNQKFFFHILC